MSVAVVEPAGLTINDPRRRIFATIEEEMRNQYAIGYPVPGKSSPTGFHKVVVKPVKSGLKVQTRNGYYASLK